MKDKKIPGVFFSTLLFLFFYFLLRTTYNDVSSMFYNMLDAAAAEDDSVILTLFMAAFEIVLLTLSFWSLIRILKGKRDGITCIRWALWLNLVILIYQLLLSLPRAILVNWVYSLIPIIKVSLVLSIIFYIAKSKTVKTAYPKIERSFSPGGWVWLSFFSIFVLVFGFAVFSVFQKWENAKDIELSRLSVPTGSYCDGRILFTSSQKWNKSNAKMLNVDMEEQNVTLWKFSQNSNKSCIWCGQSEKMRHSDFMTILLQSQPVTDSLFEKEVSSCDTIISGDQYYIDQYNFMSDSVMYTWTFAMRFDSRSNKYCAYSVYKKNTEARCEFKTAEDFLRSVIFDLKPYIKEQ